jgi:hypothetical protein
VKKIDIIYLPGYGGHFLQALFSLDPSTVPGKQIDPTKDTPSFRVENYLSTNHHVPLHMGHFIGDDYPVFPDESRHKTQFNGVHPIEYDHQSSGNQIFLVELDWSNFSNFWLMQSKKDMGYQLARLKPNEAKKNQRLKKHHAPHLINMHDFLDPSRWENEYIRINQLMDLDCYHAEAKRIYEFWYDLRVKKYAEKFGSVSSRAHADYCRQRLQEEIWGTPTEWQIFYDRVRDPSWPDCFTEENFFELPKDIQQELITVFGYQPQIPF